jgi:hypothetical protein
MATIYSLFRELTEVFTMYVELIAEQMPSREERIEDEHPLVSRTTPPGYSTPDPTAIGYRLSESETMGGGKMWTEISLSECQFDLKFNGFKGTWDFTYSPRNDIGVEIRGYDLMEVLEAALKTFQNRIAFAFGDFDGWTKDIDQEFQWYVDDRRKVKGWE